MNYLIIPTSPLAQLIPSLAAIVAKRGGHVAEKYELEDTVLRCGGFAWDIGAEAAPLHAQIAELLAAKKSADEAEAAYALANPPPPEPWRVSKDTIIVRILEAGALEKVMFLVSEQKPEQQFVWTHSTWFWNTNETLIGLCKTLGLDPDVILARDEFLT
jgi:hypothetical protein